MKPKENKKQEELTDEQLGNVAGDTAEDNNFELAMGA